MNAAEGSAVHGQAGDLLAWMDDELPPRKAAELEEHVAACEACAERLRDLRAGSELLHEALRAGDVPPPARPAVRLRRRAVRRRLIRSVPAAAVLVLVFVGAASALVPGSPLRSWLESLGQQPVPAPSPAASPTFVTRFSMVPPDSVDIFLGEPRDTLDLELVRSDGPRIEVATGRGETLDRLEFGSGRLNVDPGSVRRLRIRFPRGDRVRILLGERNLLSDPSGPPALGGETRDSIWRVRVDPEN